MARITEGHAVHLGYAGEPFIGMHLDDAIVVGAVEGVPLPARNPELRHFDVGDFHLLGSPDAAKACCEFLEQLLPRQDCHADAAR